MIKLIIWIAAIVAVDTLLGTYVMTQLDPIGFAQRHPLPVMLTTGGMLLLMYKGKGYGMAWLKKQFRKERG